MVPKISQQNSTQGNFLKSPLKGLSVYQGIMMDPKMFSMWPSKDTDGRVFGSVPQHYFPPPPHT